MSRDPLRERLERLLAALAAGPVAPAAERRPFVDYLDSDQAAARELADGMVAAARAEPGDDGLDRALGLAEAAARSEAVHGVARQAVRLFLTHYPPARERLRPTVPREDRSSHDPRRENDE